MAKRSLRNGWTTGTCATAAACAAYRLMVGATPIPTETATLTETVTLPKGGMAVLSICWGRRGGENGASWGEAGTIKDAGDDPDVTHGVLVAARVTPGLEGCGACLALENGMSVGFRAGIGVGVVSRRGLPIAVGEPAVNPAPRRMAAEGLARLAATLGGPRSVTVELSIPGGRELALRTWNPRLGIVGGLSILGTTGIVRPFSCSAWIHAIHRGVDVAMANGADHLAGATGSRSEAALRRFHGLEDINLIDMGDFAGGFLKYASRRGFAGRVTMAGGLAKLTKFMQGALDLHSARSAVDFAALSRLAGQAGLDPATCATIESARSVGEAMDGLGGAHAPQAATLIAHICRGAQRRMATLTGVAPALCEAMAVDRNGDIVGRADADDIVGRADADDAVGHADADADGTALSPSARPVAE